METPGILIRPDDPYSNDPRFRDAVLQILRGGVPTFTSPASFPGPGVRYEGMTVDYHPAGLANSPVWRCVWRQALNGGAGAWAAAGAPLAAATAGGSTVGVAGFAQVGITDSPTITVPMTGLYIVGGDLPAQCRAAGTNDAFFGFRRNEGLQYWGTYFVATAQYQGDTMSVAPQRTSQLNVGEVLSMVMAAGTAVEWMHSSSVSKSLSLTPVELWP